MNDRNILLLSEIENFEGWIIVGRKLYCPITNVLRLGIFGIDNGSGEEKICLLSNPDIQDVLIDVPEQSISYVDLLFLVSASITEFLDNFSLENHQSDDERMGQMFQELIDKSMYAIRNKIFCNIVGVGN